MRTTVTKIIVAFGIIAALIALPVMSVASMAPASQAAASPILTDRPHPDIDEEPLYCGPGYIIVRGSCQQLSNNRPNGDDPGAWVIAIFGVIALLSFA